nr:hypothetical protein Itr_chr11CG22900 [Ipomoea trifida]
MNSPPVTYSRTGLAESGAFPSLASRKKFHTTPSAVVRDSVLLHFSE